MPTDNSVKARRPSPLDLERENSRIFEALSRAAEVMVNKIAVTDRVEVGQKIVILDDIHPLDFYPNDFSSISRGETGIILEADDCIIRVLMDKKHTCLNEWDNELHFMEGIGGIAENPGTSQVHFKMYAKVVS